MPAAETMLAFLAATAVFAYVPGPAMLYATAQTLARGRRGGLAAAWGIHLGGYVHVLGAAFGLAALFEWVPSLYAALKLAGALYLVWLGIEMIRQRPAAHSGPAAPEPRTGQALQQSILVEVLNPKTAIFFVAFLPQFVDPAAALPVWAQLLFLGTIVNVMFSSADLVCVFGAGAIRARLGRSMRAVRIVRAIGGGTLIALGGRLAFDRGGPAS